MKHCVVYTVQAIILYACEVGPRAAMFVLLVRDCAQQGVRTAAYVRRVCVRACVLGCMLGVFASVQVYLFMRPRAYARKLVSTSRRPCRNARAPLGA